MTEPNEENVVKVPVTNVLHAVRSKGPHLLLKRKGSELVVDLCNRAGELNYRITVDGAELEEAVSSLGAWN